MKIILCGACGRMGKTVVQAAKESGDSIVCGLDLVSEETPFPLYHSLGEITQSADVFIDFSSAQGLEERLAYCREHALPVLLAATGYSDSDFQKIDACSRELPVFQTGNLSIGVNLVQLLVRQAAEILGDAFDAEIVERHHRMKKDAPSGTALMLANSVKEGFGAEKRFICGREGNVGARKDSEIGIHAVRGGTVVGEHEVSFYGEDEIVTVSHSARSRKIFATGALRAARWLIGKPAGRYDMNDLLRDITNPKR